jgi:5-methyltetrahydrofolate--homocysteine methyltransferase
MKDLFDKGRVLFLDGAMGTQLQERGLQPGESPELWNIVRPGDVRAVHEAYFAAGADAVYANTFGANGPAVKRSSPYTVAEVVSAGVGIAKKVLDGTGVKAVLSLGPLTQLLEPYGDLEEEECAAIYDEMLDAGVGAGADMILIQTFMDLEMMRVATVDAKKYGLPVMCSMTFEKNGKTMFGNSVEDTIDTLSPLGIEAIGLNCSLGPDLALPIIKEFSEKTDLPLLFKPNAGKPILSSDGEAVSPYTAERFAEEVKPALQYVSYIGGCCGSDADYIKEIKKML